MTLEKRVTLVASGSFFLQGAQAPYSSYVTGRWACHLLHGLGGCLRIQLLQRVNIEFRIIQMFNQFHHTHIVALFVFKWERLTKSDTALMAYQERREASTYGELYSILAQHLDMDYVWRKKMTHEQCSTTPGWLFYYRGLWYRTSHLYWGVFFFSQDKDPYDKHEKLRSPPNTSRMPLWKALFPTRRLGTSTLSWIMRWTPRLPEDYEKACTQLLAQFKTLKTFGQPEFDGRLEKTDHVESDVERCHQM